VWQVWRQLFHEHVSHSTFVAQNVCLSDNTTLTRKMYETLKFVLVNLQYTLPPIRSYYPRLLQNAMMYCLPPCDVLALLPWSCSFICFPTDSRGIGDQQHFMGKYIFGKNLPQSSCIILLPIYYWLHMCDSFLLRIYVPCFSLSVH